MSAAPQVSSELAVVTQACRVVGVSGSGAVLLRRHANAIYLLPDADLVIRLGTARSDSVDRAKRVVAVTRWLAEQGFPTVEPAEVRQPVIVDDGVVTFWRHYPQADRGYPPVTHLAGLLRRLHDLNASGPPQPLPDYRPLARFRDILDAGEGLADDDLNFLDERRQALLQSFDNLEFTLPAGLIHADAARSNTLWDGDRTVLADWDSVCVGPREQDLVLTHQNARFGLPDADRDAFARTYGFDVTNWDGYPVLRDIQELHTLTSFIRLGPRDPDAAQQLRLRIACLRRGDLTTRWTAF